jgi:ribosomal-protein-alanine N-acetyltransferase
MLEKAQLAIHIRWMIRIDLPNILEVEKLNHKYPWTSEHFIKKLQKRDNIGQTVEYDDYAIGYMIYQLHRDKLHIVRLGIHPEFQRIGVGAQLIEKLKKKLTDTRRSSLTIRIEERNNSALTFLTNLGFRAIRVDRDFYKKSQQDAYYLQYTQPIVETVASEMMIF